MRRALLTALVLAGCDLATVPAPTNPYDPAFDGPRTATAPADLRLAESTPLSVTVAWTDRSSFETGVRVERAYGVETPARFETLAVLPPDATRYTDATVVAGNAVRYRVSALVAGGTASERSDELAVRYPTDVVPLDGGPDLAQPSGLSLDGETLYVRTFRTAVLAFDTRTGRLRGEVAGVVDVSGDLADGRTVLAGTSGGRLRLAFVRGADIVQSADLDASACAAQTGFEKVAVSADGTRAALLCPYQNRLLTWHLPAPAATPEPLDGYAGVLVSLSPDGRVALVGTETQLRAVDVAARRTLWTAAVSAATAVVSPDGTAVLAARVGGGVVLLDAATGAVRAAADLGRRPGAFSADGQRVLIALATVPLFTVVVAEVPTLAPVARLFDDLGYPSRPTASGIVAGSSTGYPPAVAALRLDLGRGWQTIP